VRLTFLFNLPASRAARSFDIGVGCNVDDLIYDVIISSNTLDNDPSTSPFDLQQNVGIYLSAKIGTDMPSESTSNALVHSSVSTAAISTQSAVSSGNQQPSDEMRRSTSATDREWFIDYNTFVGVYAAVKFSYDSTPQTNMRASGSLADVNVNYNSIQLYSSCPVDKVCGAINTEFDDISGLNAINNW
jgi:hypothetical protein